MRKRTAGTRAGRSARTYWQAGRARLTPEEQKSILLVAGLFVFGAIVRWAHSLQAQ